MNTLEVARGAALAILVIGCSEGSGVRDTPSGAGAGGSNAGTTATGGEGGAGGASGTAGGPSTCVAAREPLGADGDAGHSFPDVILTACDGTKVGFDSIRCASSLTFVSIGAGWCKACLDEVPELNAAQAALSDEGVSVLHIMFEDAASNPATTLFCNNFVDSYGVQYPVYVDPAANTVGLFDTQVAPLNIVVDRDGKVLWSKVGSAAEGVEGLLRGLM